MHHRLQNLLRSSASLAARRIAGAVFLLVCAAPRLAPAASCSLAGTWAVSYEVPLNWRLNAGLEGGRGPLWVGGVIERAEVGPGRYVDNLRVCARHAPVTRTLSLYGGERYGSVLDVAGTDPEALPSAMGALQLDEAGTHFVAQPLVVSYGMAQETDQAPFPRSLAEAQKLAASRAGDGRPGVRLSARTDGGLSLPPTNARGSRRAVTFDALLRDAWHAHGQVVNCDALSGEVTVPELDGKPGVQGFIVGCTVAGGGDCERRELGLINAFAPNFRPEPGSVHMVRIQDGGGCAEALGALLP